MLESIQIIDFLILDWIQSNLRGGWLDRLMPKITFLGEAGLLWIVIAVAFLLWKPRRRCGVKMTIGLVFCLVIGLLVLKNVVARPRPCWINTDIEMLVEVPLDYSFPSGHTMSSITSALLIFFEDKRIGIPALVMAVLISISRLHLYVHFPSDVLAGAILGAAVAVLVDRLVDKYLPVKDTEATVEKNEAITQEE